MKRFSNTAATRIGLSLPQHQQIKQLQHECKQLENRVHHCNKCHCIQSVISVNPVDKNPVS